MLYLCLFGPPHGCYPLDLRVLVMPVTPCGFLCGCRVVVGYVQGIMLGWGVVGVWMGMFADWAVRAVLFYWRMVTGRWLWKYPRSEPQKCEKKPVVSE